MSKHDNQNANEKNAYLNSLKDKSIEELKVEAEKARLINEINNGGGNTNDLHRKLKSMKTGSIVSIVLCFFIIGFFVAIIMDLVYGISILSTDWKDKELDDSKTLWGLLTLLLLGTIGSLVFACKGLKRI